jgi:hypothetical protein
LRGDGSRINDYGETSGRCTGILHGLSRQAKDELELCLVRRPRGRAVYGYRDLQAGSGKVEDLSAKTRRGSRGLDNRTRVDQDRNTRRECNMVRERSIIAR